MNLYKRQRYQEKLRNTLECCKTSIMDKDYWIMLPFKLRWENPKAGFTGKTLLGIFLK